jgi:hypothetical protein
MLALSVLVLGAPPPAHADVFEKIELLSQGFLPGAGIESAQQVSYAHDPAISANGQYVAFDGAYGGLTGVWRRDLQSGEIQPVAVGHSVPGFPGRCEPAAGGASSACDAELPSISENGQYVSFTTTAPLAPNEDTNATSPDVYVRNMDIEASEPQGEACAQAEREDAEELTSTCPFTLVSAADGSDEGLTYSGRAEYGSVAAGRTAITADGEQVAFVTTAISDLTDPQEPHAPDTPAMQVAVRNLRTRQTSLVSARYDPERGEAVPGEAVSGEQGAVFSNKGALAPSFPFGPGGYTVTEPAGASISADGSTVAWLGVDVREQAKTLSAEGLDPSYAEPLWRRIGEGPTTPTRRVTGGGDPENPACAASGETAMPNGSTLANPCQGPFATAPNEGVWKGGEKANFLPQLSADGYTVAFLGDAPLVAQGSDFGQNRETRHSDLYLANMHPGRTRVQALRPLTELAGAGEGSLDERIATIWPIVDLAISGDGSQVAFTTERTIFPLGAPAFVSPVAAVPGMSELFDADLADETLTRVTEGFEGGPSAHPHAQVATNEDPYANEDDGALSPSFSGDGELLAFSSTASNLVYGDGNTPPRVNPPNGPFDGADVFVVRREVFSPAPTPQFASPAPANPTPTPIWRLGATAQSLPNGSVRVYVTVPGAGKLRALAQGWVLVHKTHAATKARGAGRGRGSARAVAASARRTLAQAGAIARDGEGELLTLTLTLAKSYRSLASAHGGCSATVELSFAAPGHPTLKQSLAVTFAAAKRKTVEKHATGARGAASRGKRSVVR